MNDLLKGVHSRKLANPFFMKNKLQTYLLDYAEDKILKKDVRYRTKYVNHYKTETDFKRGFENRNNFIETNIEGGLQYFSNEGEGEMRKIQKIYIKNEKILAKMKEKKEAERVLAISLKRS